MRRMSLTLVAAALVLTGISGSAFAGSINISTGLDSSNQLLTSNGQADAHWVVGLTPGSPAAQAVYPGGPDWYGGWLANGPGSTWIARDASTSANGANIYSITFDLTGWDLSTVVISGGWAVDDIGVLALNGHRLDALNAGAWGGLTPFSHGSSYLEYGLNTLSIAITDTDNYLEAVRLEGTITGSLAAPEPSTVVSAVLGAGALLGAARRRRRLA